MNLKSGWNDKTRRSILKGTLAGAAAGFLPKLAFGQANPELAIGVMGPYTGPSSRSGDEFKRGVAMALDDAKKAGELPLKIDGKATDVRVVWVDEQSSPEKAVKATLDAIERENVKFFVGGFSSAVALAVMDVEAPHRIIHLGHTGEAQTVSEKVNSDPQKYAGWFKGWPAPPLFAGRYGPLLSNLADNGGWKPANRKAAIIVEDTDFGRGLGQALFDSLKANGFDPLPYDVAPADQTEFTPVLIKYKALGVSLVAMTFTGSVSAANFVKQFASQRVKALLVGHGLGWFGEWYQLTGNASDYVIAANSPRAITNEQKAWVADYKKRFNLDPSLANAGLPYDYMRLAIRTLNQTGSLDFDALRKTLLNNPYDGVWQFYQFAKKPGPDAMAYNEVEVGDFKKGFFFPLVQLMDGQAVIISPKEYATGSFKNPPWL